MLPPFHRPSLSKWPQDMRDTSLDETYRYRPIVVAVETDVAISLYPHVTLRYTNVRTGTRRPSVHQVSGKTHDALDSELFGLKRISGANGRLAWNVREQVKLGRECSHQLTKR